MFTRIAITNLTNFLSQFFIKIRNFTNLLPVSPAAIFGWIFELQSGKMQKGLRREFRLTFFTVIFSFVFLADCYSQVIVSGALVGNGTYTKLSTAFSAINGGSQTGANITITITANVTETSTAQLNSGTWNSINISPSGDRTVTGNISGNSLIRLEGADRVKIDGLRSGSNFLHLVNTSTSSTSFTSTLLIINGASNNRIANCIIVGSSTTGIFSMGGNVVFSSGSNTNNTITDCVIGSTGDNTPSKGIFFAGSTNTLDTIKNCEIRDYFLEGGSSAGICMGGGTSDISIISNKFYQTYSRNQNSASQHSAIWIENTAGNNFRIIGNIIGYSTFYQTGTYTVSGNNSASKLHLIYVNAGSGGGTSIQGNTFTSISYSGIMSGTFAASPFSMIYVNEGLIDVGNINGNIIGSTSSTNSITYSTNSAANSHIFGIYLSRFASHCNTSSNTIAGITASNSGAGSMGIVAIMFESPANWTCQNNVIGGSIANSITNTSSAVSSCLLGLANKSVGANSVCNITGNTIRNMTVAGGAPGDFQSPLSGIFILVSSIGARTVSQNTIYALSNTNTSQACVVSGIYIADYGTVERNFIHSLSASSNSAVINGIYASTINSNYNNNMIRLGITSSGSGLNSGAIIYGIYESGGANNFYFNSIYIGGNPTSSANSTFAFRTTASIAPRNYVNNIFYNARSNNGSTGKHYAVYYITAHISTIKSNNNILYVSGAGSVLGLYGGSDRPDLSSWKSATGLDSNSHSANPNFINPAANSDSVNLHIAPNLPSYAEGLGLFIPSITNDFDNNVRASLSPTDIGADAGIFAPADLQPMTISFTPLPNDTNKTTKNFTGINISDPEGVDGSANFRPRVYFKKRSAPNSFINNTSSTTGWKFASANGSSSPFSFTIDLTKLNLQSAATDTIQYFVVAQDLAPTPHIFSNTVTFASYFSSVQLTSAAFPVSGTPDNFVTIGAPLAGDYTIGLTLFNQIMRTNIYFKSDKQTQEEIIVPMQNGLRYEGPLDIKRKDNPEMSSSAMMGVYANITTAIDDLKLRGANGPVRFLLLDNSYTSETLPISITPWSGMSPVNTLTIKTNDGVTSTISGNNATAVFDINNGDYFTLDGSNTSGENTKDLTIVNSNTSASTIRFVNDAKNNTIKNCILKGSSMSVTNGVVFFSTTNGASGNDSNLIQNNDITKNASPLFFCVYNFGTGSTSVTKNSNNRIIGNRCFDFQSRGIVDEGNSAGTLYEGNEIYSVSAQPGILVGIRIVGTSIEGFTVRNNYIHDLKLSSSNLIYGIEINSIQSSFYRRSA